MTFLFLNLLTESLSLFVAMGDNHFAIIKSRSWNLFNPVKHNIHDGCNLI